MSDRRLVDLRLAPIDPAARPSTLRLAPSTLRLAPTITRGRAAAVGCMRAGLGTAPYPALSFLHAEGRRHRLHRGPDRGGHRHDPGDAAVAGRGADGAA